MNICSIRNCSCYFHILHYHFSAKYKNNIGYLQAVNVIEQPGWIYIPVWCAPDSHSGLQVTCTEYHISLYIQWAQTYICTSAEVSNTLAEYKQSNSHLPVISIRLQLIFQLYSLFSEHEQTDYGYVLLCSLVIGAITHKQELAFDIQVSAQMRRIKKSWLNCFQIWISNHMILADDDSLQGYW